MMFSLWLKSSTLTFLNMFGRVDAMEVSFAFYQRGLGYVFQKSRNVSRLFRVLKFPLYLIFATPRFEALELRNPLGFSYTKNILKD